MNCFRNCLPNFHIKSETLELPLPEQLLPFPLSLSLSLWQIQPPSKTDTKYEDSTGSATKKHKISNKIDHQSKHSRHKILAIVFTKQ